MLKRLVIVVLAAVGVVMVLAMRQPDTFTVERRTSVAAPPERVFAQINDFHNWANWSPWAKLDPAMTLSITGPASGVGAVYEWKGNSDVGSGRMEIKESQAPNQVTIDLHFLTPIESRSLTTFQITPTASGSDVIWTMRGENSFFSRIMNVFTSMDAMIGPDFEKGLAQLKTATAA